MRLRREYALMKVVRHHNLIKLLDVLENPQEIIIIMEYASHGDLFEYIVTQPENRLSEEQAKHLFAQIALGKCTPTQRTTTSANDLFYKKAYSICILKGLFTATSNLKTYS